MKPVPVFHARVVNGKLDLEAAERELRRDYLRTLEGKAVDVVVKVHRNKRSVDQNRWLFGVAIPLIAEGLGYDLDEHEMLHYALIDECFGVVFDERLGRDVPKVRSSKLDTKTFSEYMEWLVRWAAREHGISVPLPDEAEEAA